MNTKQSYVGKGNYTNSSTPAAKNGSQSPSTPDNRPDVINVDRHFYEAQTRLPDLVDDFMMSTNASEPIEVINTLLYDWLTASSVNQLEFGDNRDKLFAAFELVNFLAKLYEELNSIHGLLAEKKEVGNEQ